MEETDATPWPGGGDSLPEVLCPPAWTAECDGSTETRLLRLHWDAGSVSPCCRPRLGSRGRRKGWKPKAAVQSWVVFPLKSGIWNSTSTHLYSFKYFHIPVRQEGVLVPHVVRCCVEEVERRGLDEVGIYRVSGTSSDIGTLKAAFNSSKRRTRPAFCRHVLFVLWQLEFCFVAFFTLKVQLRLIGMSLVCGYFAMNQSIELTEMLNWRWRQMLD